MAFWLYEAGIGEARAALIDKNEIAEMRIEPDDQSARVGMVCDARLVRAADATGRARVMLASGEADLAMVPPATSIGMTLRVEIVRESLPERGAIKLPRVRVVAADVRDAPDLLARITSTGIAVRQARLGEDDLEAHGWSERMEEAATGIVAHEDALLRISLTPAMTLIDVDGTSLPTALAIAGARRSGETIRRFGITGSIGIDLPTLSDKTQRQAAAAALDAVLPQPFERTAVNGFGFLQIVRRRERPSLPELLAADPVAAAARALLRRAERTRGAGAVTLSAAPSVIAAIEARFAWMAELSRRTGADVRLQALSGLPISGGHAQRHHA